MAEGKEKTDEKKAESDVGIEAEKEAEGATNESKEGGDVEVEGKEKISKSGIKGARSILQNVAF